MSAVEMKQLGLPMHGWNRLEQRYDGHRAERVRSNIVSLNAFGRGLTEGPDVVLSSWRNTLLEL